MTDTRHLVFSLTGFKSPDAEKVTGGTISNYYFLKSLLPHFNITLLTPQRNLSLHERMNMRIIDIQHKAGGIFGRYFYEREIIQQLINPIGINRDSIVVSNGINNIATGIACKKSQAKHIIIVRDLYSFPEQPEKAFKNRQFSEWLKSARDYNRLRTCMKNATAIITNSQWMKNEIAQRMTIDRGKIQVLYPPLDIDQHCLPSGIPANAVGFINRDTVKGHELVIAIARLMPELSFKVFGDIGPFQHVHLPANIELVGYVSRDKIYTAIDILIAPSTFPEPFGRVAIEAQSNGVPILVANSGGLREAVASEQWILDDYDAIHWQKKIRSTLANTAQNTRILAEWNAGAKHTFSIETHNRNVLDFFNGLFDN